MGFRVDGRLSIASGFVLCSVYTYIYIYDTTHHGEEPIHAGVAGSKLGSSPKSPGQIRSR